VTVFCDASALVARWLPGPARGVVDEALRNDHDWCASALARFEAVTLADRVADPSQATALRGLLRDDWDRLWVVPVDNACLDRATALARTHPLQIVDAIHLAAADRLQRPLTYVTFDPHQIPVAMALGFNVVSTVAGVEAARPAATVTGRHPGEMAWEGG
jgi:predicted nucleic acid-binding protein